MNAALAVVLLLAGGTTVPANEQDWLQWGGPERNFRTRVTSVPTPWPPDGPRRSWSRPLGEGYSSILFERGILYTMFRDGDRENVIALEAASGKTLWTFTYDAPTTGMNLDQGRGPHATPLIVGDRLFAVGAKAHFHCLNKNDGTLIWSHNLYDEFGAMFRNRGYSASPLAYRDTVILTAGGKPNQSLMSFRQSDGAVVWRGGDLGQSQASPILVDVHGQLQVIAFLGADVAGFDPDTGAMLWSHPHPTTSNSGMNITTPFWDGDVLFVSSSYNGGTRALRLKRPGGKTTVEELWFHRQMRIPFSTLMPVGELLFGSSGDLALGILTAVDKYTGELIWRDRTFATASFLDVGGKLLLLDADGTLALVSVTRDGLQIHERAGVFSSLSRTVPTLVGTRLFLRNRETIMALDLETQSTQSEQRAERGH